MSRNGCNFVKEVGWRCVHACLQANYRFIFHHLVFYPITERSISIACHCNCLIVISANPSIDLHDKSRKLRQFFQYSHKLGVDWGLVPNSRSSFSMEDSVEMEEMEPKKKAFDIFFLSFNIY
jgi:hypothetical protein